MKKFILTFLCLGFAIAAIAQTSVTGNVVDNNGEAIVGATVLEQGTTNGTITDVDGGFSLTVGSPNATLQISFVSYKDQTVALNGRTTIKVVLQDDSQMLQDVVAIGYGRVKKTDATGSVTAIKPDELNKGLATSPQDVLMGKVAGVSIITGGGTPGGGATIRIRGGSSLNASNDPLIVIDGLAMDNKGMSNIVANPLSTINPNDIESFTILKDASATAIYGSRASNGVIIITTKKGKEGSKPKFTYNGNVSLSTLVKRIEVLDAQKLKDYAAYLKIDKPAYMGNANTDWQSEIYRPAAGTDHNFTIAGGAKNMPYRVSLGITYQDGIIKTSNMHRATLSGSLNPSFLDKHLTLNINVKGSYIGNRFADDGVVGGAISFDPTQPVFGIDKTQREQGEDGSHYGGYYQPTDANIDGTSPYGDLEWMTKINQYKRNPVSVLDLRDRRSKAVDLVGNLEANYKIHGFEDLRLNVNLAAEYAKGVEKIEVSPYSGTNHYYGYYGSTDKYKYNLSFTAFAQYVKEFAKETQNIDIMAGYEYQRFMLEKGVNHNYGLFQETHPTRAGEKYNEVNSVFADQLYLVSLFGRLNYNAWNRYLFTVTLRYDGSSYFHPDRRFGLFPSVAFAWKIKEEKFLRNVKAIDELKLRLGWGNTGQQDIGEARYLTIFFQSLEHAYYPLGETDPVTGDYIYYSSYRPRGINTAVTWEVTTTYNAGLDFSFIKGRISGAIDFYYRITNNLINGEVDVLAGTNFQNKIAANIGQLVNKGVEFTLNTKPIVKRDFNWSIDFNASYNKNTITDLYTGAYVLTGPNSSASNDSQIKAYKTGYSSSSFYVYETKKDAEGNWYFVDQNNDGQINADDRRCYKQAAPVVVIGLSTTFTYKKFDLSIAFRSHIGNYMYNDVLVGSLRNVEKANFFANKTGGFQNVTKAAYDTYWGGFKSDNPNLNGEYHKSDYFVQNASFLRCDKITLGYNFTKPNIRLYATVQNPFVITGYKGLDPEKFDGVDNNMYPRSLVSMVGITYNF